MGNSPYRNPEPLVDPKQAALMRAQYAVDRMVWARGLNDNDVRAMAADYLRGQNDECSTDAYAEYQRRFGPSTHQHIAQSRSKKAQRAAKQRK